MSSNRREAFCKLAASEAPRLPLMRSRGAGTLGQADPRPRHALSVLSISHGVPPATCGNQVRLGSPENGKTPRTADGHLSARTTRDAPLNSCSDGLLYGCWVLCPQVNRTGASPIARTWLARSLRGRRIVAGMAPAPPPRQSSHVRCARIAHRTYSHPQVFTVAEAVALRGTLPAAIAKASSSRTDEPGCGSSSRSRSGRSDLKRLAAALLPRAFLRQSALLYECRPSTRAASRRFPS